MTLRARQGWIFRALCGLLVAVVLVLATWPLTAAADLAWLPATASSFGAAVSLAVAHHEPPQIGPRAPTLSQLADRAPPPLR